MTRDFLSRINNLFPHQLTFHLTCDSQKEQMEKIRNSCTNLSRDVENKFQLYLDKVGDKVSAKCSVFLGVGLIVSHDTWTYSEMCSGILSLDYSTMHLTCQLKVLREILDIQMRVISLEGKLLS